MLEQNGRVEDKKIHKMYAQPVFHVTVFAFTFPRKNTLNKVE